MIDDPIVIRPYRRINKLYLSVSVGQSRYSCCRARSDIIGELGGGFVEDLELLRCVAEDSGKKCLVGFGAHWSLRDDPVVLQGAILVDKGREVQRPEFQFEIWFGGDDSPERLVRICFGELSHLLADICPKVTTLNARVMMVAQQDGSITPKIEGNGDIDSSIR